jgi:ERCC4-type nuclease
MYSQLSNAADKQMCLSAITTLFYFKGFSVFRTCSVFETAEFILGMAKKIQKEIASGKTPRYSATLESRHSDLEQSLTPISPDVIAMNDITTTMNTLSPGLPYDSNPSTSNNLTHTILPTSSDVIAKPYCEVVHKVKKDNITPENIGEIILCSIPGISSTSAIEIMKHYSSFANFMEELNSRPGKLDDIYLTTNGKRRKLGKNIIENIKRFLIEKK